MGWFNWKVHPHTNFSECTKLQFVNVGNNPYHILNVSIFPRTLTELGLNYISISEIPDLGQQTPLLEILHIEDNLIAVIPSERLRRLTNLRHIFMARNRLLTLPDVTGTDITKMSLTGNPWACNYFLCTWGLPPDMTFHGDPPNVWHSRSLPRHVGNGCGSFHLLLWLK